MGAKEDQEARFKTLPGKFTKPTEVLVEKTTTIHFVNGTTRKATELIWEKPDLTLDD